MNEPPDQASALTLVAILRGIRPGEVESIGEALIDAGLRTIEVPLNSPAPFESIRRLSTRFAEQAIIGAGTVLEQADVARVADAGGQIIVMPHCDLSMIGAAKAAGLACMPGVATPSEAFAALAAGADALKAFPAEAIAPEVIKAWLAVLPRGTGIFPVGGITPAKLGPTWQLAHAGSVSDQRCTNQACQLRTSAIVRAISCRHGSMQQHRPPEYWCTQPWTASLLAPRTARHSRAVKIKTDDLRPFLARDECRAR